MFLGRVHRFSLPSPDDSRSFYLAGRARAMAHGFNMTALLDPTAILNATQL